MVRADAGSRSFRVQCRECSRIGSCRLSQCTVGLRDFPHYKIDNSRNRLMSGVGAFSLLQIELRNSFSEAYLL